MFEKTVEIKTADGIMDTFICHPEEGGPHPDSGSSTFQVELMSFPSGAAIR